MIGEDIVTAYGPRHVFCSESHPAKEDAGLAFALDELGVTWFLTREEAEKKWKEIQNESVYL